MITVPYIKSLSKIVDKYEVFILDQWGVMHDGKKGYPEAVKCVQKLMQYKKKLLIISNSSKRKKSICNRLSKLGFNKDNFIEVMTSGEMIWKSLHLKSQKFVQTLGKNCYHLYDETNVDESRYIDGLNYNFVKNIEKADFILGCNVSPGKSTLDYVPLLKKAIENDIPFVCANPDFETVEFSSSNFNICMGAVSTLYSEFGGKVFILGKPSIKIYNEATKKLKEINKSKILAIGDSIHHDIKGALLYGVDSLLITSGIHQSSFDKYNPKWDTDINELIKYKILPTYFSSKFQF